MISDVLSDAVVEIDAYLSEMPDVYQGEVLVHVLSVRQHMDTVRQILDSVPKLHAVDS